MKIHKGFGLSWACGHGHEHDRDTGHPRGLDCEIPRRWRGERNIPYEGMETSS